MDNKDQPAKTAEPEKQPAVPKDDDDDEVDDNYDPQEEVWIPSKNKEVLPEIKVETGEEADTPLATFRVKTYRFRNGEWKERGVGEAKFLKAHGTEKVRFLARNDKTLRVICNHYILREGKLGTYSGPLGRIQPLKTAQNTWTWSAYDNSDDKPRVETFAVRLSTEEFPRFKTEFDKAVDLTYSVPKDLSAEERDKFLTDLEKKAAEPKKEEEVKKEEPAKV